VNESGCILQVSPTWGGDAFSAENCHGQRFADLAIGSSWKKVLWGVHIDHRHKRIFLSGTIEEHAAMGHEQVWKLKEDSVPGIRVDDQLRARNVLRERVRIEGRDHHVMMPIHDQRWLRNVLEF
jgi:hypothetical protein